MAISKNRLLQILEHNKPLMGMDEDLNKIAAANKDYINYSLEEGHAPQSNNNLIDNLNDFTPTDIDFENSKLPKEILEAMSSNPIDTSKLGNLSILDEAEITPKLAQKSIPQLKRGVLKENTSQTIPNMVTSNNIDYSLIKTIVEDCVKKAVGAIKKSVLTENTINNGDEISILKLGENFKFVTKTGDIYEAKLRKIGNINKK